MIAPPNLSVLFVIACFWLVYLVVSWAIVKPLGRILDERLRTSAAAQESLGSAQDTLKGALARCERELASAGLEAGKQRQALRAEGEVARAARLASAREQAQATLAALSSELDDATAQARATIRSQVPAMARELAGRLAGRGMSS